MSEEAHLHIAHTHNAHPRSQSKNKQMKSTKKFSPQRNWERQVKESFETLGK